MKEIKIKQNRTNDIKAVIWYIASRIFILYQTQVGYVQ